MNRVYKIQPAVDSRLAELGLSKELLREAVSVGLAGFFSCTTNHPPSFPGISSWAEMTRALREGLLLKGWDRFNDRNLPLTVNQQTGIAIAASSGDECTGIAELAPRTRNPKGSATKDLADANAVQLGLFTDMGAPVKEMVEETAKWETWFLLSYRDFQTGVVRSELSKPINIGDDGRVDGWDERIILDEIPFGGEQVPVTGSGGRNSDGSLGLDNLSEAVDVIVKRRA